MIFSSKNKIARKIFCISFQRTGTTSTGNFFKDFNRKVATYHTAKKNSWTLSWFKGDFEAIFNSKDFKSNEIFEDDPWWCADFYKVLFHRFPDSKFILLERDPDKWFDSMVSHSNGKVLGNTHMHANLYNREKEFYLTDDANGQYTGLIDNMLPLSENNREHYKSVYTNRNREVDVFFDKFGKNRLFKGELTDPNIWYEIGRFFDIEVPESYMSHKNASSL